MLSENDTKERIEKILQEAFLPLHLEVIDESYLHHKHKEAMNRPSAGYFKVIMHSALFDGMDMIKRHRMVYEKIGDMMVNDIHALSLKLHASNEMGK